jgi:CubicO group peptidase (beta-lactamase class C family)
MCPLLVVACAAPERPASSAAEGSKQRAAFTRVEPARLDAFVAATIERLAIPGLAMAIVHNGVVLHEKAYGQADLENDVPVTLQSPFKIASLTKPITAIAVLQLVARGRLILDSPAGEYLDGLPPEWRASTVRQLLAHTSGVPDYLQSPAWSWRDSWQLARNHQEVITLAAAAPMTFRPGDGMKYSNTNYYVLGMLIERTTGMSYSEYIDAHIFKPLGMSNSRLDRAAALVPRRVRGYTREQGTLRNAEFTSDTWAYSEGGVITTAPDLAKLEQALHTEDVLTRASLDLMWTPTKLNDGRDGVIGDNGAGQPNHYGLGWFISSYKGRRLILAGGNKPGFTCTFFRFIDEGLTIILLSNLSSSPLYGMAGEIAEMYLDG